MFDSELQQTLIDSISKYTTNKFISPCIVYDLNILTRILEKFREQIPNELKYKLFYAVKANINKEILNFLSNKIDGVDVATVDELAIAKEYFSPERISINGPSFRDEELRYFQEQNFLVDINFISSVENMNPNIDYGIRVMEVNDQNVSVSRFGINIFSSKILNIFNSNKITRLHLHFGEKDEAFIQKLDKILSYLEEIDMLKNINELNLGGGYLYLFVSNNLGTFFSSLLELYKKYGIEDRITTIFEPGRALINFSAYMVANPINVSHQENYQLVTLNTSIYRNSLWFSPKIVTTINSLGNEKIQTKIFGNTCFEDDKYPYEISLPPLQENSSIIFFPVGAYVKSNHSNLHNTKFMKEVYL